MRRIDWLAITVLLLFAAALRILGISHGQLDPAYFPSYAPFGMVHEQIPIHPDEFFSVGVPVNMALRNRLNPEVFYYPSFIINTNYVLLQLTRALEGQSLADREGKTLRAFADFPLYVFSRMYSVFGGMLQVACAYAVAKLMANRYAALCAGLLVAVSYTLVQHAHYIKPGSLATGWMMLAAWACFAALYARGQGRRSILVLFAGVVTGLAATTRYNALAVSPLLFCTGLILVHRHRTTLIARRVVISWLLVPVVFVIGSPYVLRDFEHFWRDFTYVASSYTNAADDGADYFVVDHSSGLAHLILYAGLMPLGVAALAMAALSVLAAWKERPRGDHFNRNSLSLGVALICSVILPYAWVALRTIRLRSDTLLLLILPFVALLSAIGADWLMRRIRLPTRIAMPIMALALVVQPLVFSVQVVKMFRQPDTRNIMLQWIQENIPRGSRFFLNGPYNVPLDEAIYSSDQQFLIYAETLPEATDYDYMIFSDVLAFDILRSQAIVPAEAVEQQRKYLLLLDQTYRRVAEIKRPTWTGSEVMVNMAAHWHNPTLILYCVNPARCEA
ncbi:MAG: hypothetical protein OXG78_02935 [Chloroflexi bacterium]|nr:hypothetical protein [Chloroflexota bacterium]